MATTGLGTTVAVKVTSSTSPVLVLSGTEQNLSAQITAEAVDIAGNVQADVQLYYYSSDESTASVDSDGLVIGVLPGVAVITVAAPAFGNSIGTFGNNGLPANYVYQELTVQVTEYGSGTAIVPSFSFTLSEDSATISPTGKSSPITITQTIANGDPGPVTYSFYGNQGTWNWADSITNSPSPTIWFAFSNNVSGSTTSTFTVSAGAGASGTPSTPGTYTGFIIGTSQHYNPNAPAGSPSMAGASTTSPGTFTYALPFTVTVT